MKRPIQIFLCCVFLLAALCLPTQARMIVGLTSTAPLSRIDQATSDQLGRALADLSGSTVKVRRFEDTAAITNWLLRFQEIDAAIVAPGFIKQQPAGTLKHLADLHAEKSASPPLALVTRSNLSSDQASRIKQAFLKLGASDSGRKVLAKLGLAGVTSPGETLKRVAIKAETMPLQPAEKKASSSLAQTKQPVALKAEKKDSVSPQPSEEKQQTTAIAKEQRPTDNIITPTAATEEIIRASNQPEPNAEPSKKPVVQEPARKEFASDAPQAKPAANKRLLLFAALVLFLAILTKACLFAMRWQNEKKSSHRREETPAIRTGLELDQRTVPVTEKESTLTAAELVIEAGKLSAGKVPALLKRCADLPRPVVLKITNGSSEKLVYFAGGHVSGALTQSAATSESGVRWCKLGNLLIREELITEEGCEQGMALLAEESKLRFGEALLKLGLIDLAGLRHALTRQAKATIYSLILFPEGHYQISAGDGSLPPEESVSLGINALIREASHHQAEWTAIRQALPSLNKVLAFVPEGRCKLDKVSISSQQEVILSLIDGERTINELCLESSMMDYEVYRFLYLMVKAGVLI